LLNTRKYRTESKAKSEIMMKRQLKNNDLIDSAYS